jgi:hypothetical protein
MFLKQHSVIDVCLALALYGVCYEIVYLAIPQYRKKTAVRSTHLGHFPA